MARPRKCRRICRMPRNTHFAPQDGGSGQEISMTLDEFECIRLIDLEHLQQEQCALRMNVARTTVQSIYLAARSKLADALVHGKSLRIEGGDVMLCQSAGACCPDVCDAHCPCGQHDCSNCTKKA